MKKLQIALASGNQGKTAELSTALAEFDIELISLDKFGDFEEVEETGETFRENALIKARAAAARTGLIAIADDSGLCVDALGGRPGVFSARYGNDWPSLPKESRDSRNIRKLLAEMKNAAPNQRSAHFETVIAAVAPNGAETTASGQWHGEILESPIGHNGFGYDPVFFDPALGKSAAQLTRAEKTAVSHRGKAIKSLLGGFQEFLAKAGAQTRF